MGSGSVQSVSEGTLNPCQSVTHKREGGLKSAESFWWPVAICPCTNVMDHLQAGHLQGLVWGCNFPVSSGTSLDHWYSQQHLEELHSLPLCWAIECAAKGTSWGSNPVSFLCSQSFQHAPWLQRATLKAAPGASVPPALDVEVSVSP